MKESQELNKKPVQRDTARKATLAAINARQRARERKRTALIFGGVGALILTIIVAVSIVVTAEIQDGNAAKEAAGRPIEGVQAYENLGRDHTLDPVFFEQSPPVGGNHHPLWTNCGIYTRTLPKANTVHSLEHGAVWISYQPEIGQSQIDELAALVGKRSYVLLSPYPGQDAPVIATAWGLQLKVDSADDSRLPTFLDKYIQGPQTPEPGAPCSGGITP
ncbi:hypothetical protein A5N17_13755 [Arthrobacter sp. D2]|jgi:hypothetical protein|uniref:DUF3105 domain-containing protein n=1 Tax=Arthrobacter sp. J3.40 TaxID=347209 RepID=UPI00084E7086|nr:DUF3105 domain-containing protein [Arthrobacter sp. J3.40]NKR10561.1 hypothetical protein [Arthrobacter sp. M5]NKR15202.1 hypothetical protein [Arthrobacter sp. M6]OEH61566.1 hypothetical protein A5N17_13755 [Arthrobacter sp. D2]OEH61625.1 hypothetical protein A5N13_16175 [Arthrobacter sp. D4]